MTHVHIAADTFGRVKTVRGTSVVTRFWGVQMMPFLPTNSYYVAENNTQHAAGIPFTAIPCAEVDRTSATMAYARGLCGGLLIIGFIAVIPLYSIWLNVGPGPDAHGILIMKVLIGCFFAGILGGAATYLVPTTPRRERQIREHCGIVLGPAIDPARITDTAALDLQAFYLTAEDSNFLDTKTWELRRELIITRCEIALGKHDFEAERKTDDLLLSLGSAQ